MAKVRMVAVARVLMGRCGRWSVDVVPSGRTLDGPSQGGKGTQASGGPGMTAGTGQGAVVTRPFPPDPLIGRMKIEILCFQGVRPVLQAQSACPTLYAGRMPALPMSPTAAAGSLVDAKPLGDGETPGEGRKVG